MKTYLWHSLILLGIILLLIEWKFGLAILNVFQGNWWLVPCSDAVPGILSWDYFREEVWHYPLGKIEGYNYPLTTNIALTDGIPLMAVVFKLLHPFFDGEAYYYFGVWFAISFLLQAFFGYRLLSVFLPKRAWLVLLGTIFFLLSPVFLHRFAHHGLAIHWMILASFYYYFQTNFSAAKRLGAQTILIALMAWTHPYAAMMALLLGGATLLKISWQERVIPLWQLLAVGIAWIGMTLGLWEVMGYFSVGEQQLKNSNFGLYSANANALFNSFDKTSILPALPIAKDGQYEGFAFLGVGVLLLLLASLIFFPFVKRKTSKWRLRKAYLPLLLVIFLATLFSFSAQWTFGETVFAKMDYPDFLARRFRASGRFIWLLHYASILGIIVCFARLNLRNEIKIGVFLIAIGIQFYDIQPLVQRGYVQYEHPNHSFHKNTWQPLLNTVERIWTYPLHAESYLDNCDYGKLVNIAQSQQIPISAGRVIYFNWKEWENSRTYIEQQLASNIPDEQQAAFITSFEQYEAFRPLVEANELQAFLVESYLVFLPTSLYQNNEQFKDWQPINKELNEGLNSSITAFVEQYPKATLLFSVKDDARTNLGSEFIEWMRTKGSNIQTLPYRGSYAAIMRYHQIVDEQISENETVNVELSRLKVTSAGHNSENFSSITVDDKEYSPNKRGVNIVVMEQDSVVRVVNFDTYRSAYFGSEAF